MGRNDKLSWRIYGTGSPHIMCAIQYTITGIRTSLPVRIVISAAFPITDEAGRDGIGGGRGAGYRGKGKGVADLAGGVIGLLFGQGCLAKAEGCQG